MSSLKRCILFTSVSLFTLVGCGGSSDSDSEKDGQTPTDNGQKAYSKQYNMAVSSVNNTSQSVNAAYQRALAISDDMPLSEVQSRVDILMEALLAYADALREMDTAGSQVRAQAFVYDYPMGTKHAPIGDYQVSAQNLFEDFLGYLPGASSVGAAHAAGVRDTVAKAKEKGAHLKELVDSEEISNGQYGNTLVSELKGALSTGADWLFSGFMGVTVGATVGGVASAAGVTLVPALAIGAVGSAVGGTAGLIYNYVFTSGEVANGKCSSDCSVTTGKSNDKGQIFVPADTQGNLVLSSPDNHPISISGVALSEGDANAKLIADNTPVSEPFEPKPVVINPPEAVEPTAPELTCSDISSLSASFALQGPGEVWMKAKVIPDVSGCELDLSGVRISSESGSWELEDMRFDNDETLSLLGPGNGDFTVSLTLSAADSEARRSLSETIEQDALGAISIEPVNDQFWLKVGESVPVGYLAQRVFFSDGSSSIILGSDNPNIQWRFDRGVGDFSNGDFSSEKSGTGVFTVSFTDDNDHTVQTVVSILVKPAEGSQPVEPERSSLIGSWSGVFSGGGDTEDVYCPTGSTIRMTVMDMGDESCSSDCYISGTLDLTYDGFPAAALTFTGETDGNGHFTLFASNADDTVEAKGVLNPDNTGSFSYSSELGCTGNGSLSK